MKRIFYFVVMTFVCICGCDAAVRVATSGPTRQTVSSRQSPTTNTRTVRATTPRVASRQTNNVSRVATATIQRVSNQTSRRTTNARSGTSRTATNIATQTFDSGYNVCRDAYFTCMDQFCAQQNDSYRRCVCSSRLSEIQSRERSLSEASDSLATFKDLNIDIIPKTSAEVKAMLTASAGEHASKKDTSDASKQLNGISAILAKTKSQSLSTNGTIDIGGNINSIWANTDLASGVNIANLSGEQLYNAVNAQCAEFVSEKCPSASIKNMVISAYGMYIENDCALLISALDKKHNLANSEIRATEHEMDNARLENYNAHNSTSINDCLANVRADITSDSACGTDYVHCLDVTGLYLNKLTGEPIYTANFYQLEMQISLSDDILTNKNNQLLVAELNGKRKFAEKSLETCRDLSDDVWNEFMRQAITEIYQTQQYKIRQVKDECLDVVNTCYDEKTNSLRDFSNIDANLLIGSSLELAEEMCQEKLNTCSNLYGQGAEGMRELLTAMHEITDQKIAASCKTNLESYVKKMCAVPSIDTIHSYPYACRVYTPGEQRFARIEACNIQTKSNQTSDDEDPDSEASDNIDGCPIEYTTCFDGYYLKNKNCFMCPTRCATCQYNDTNNKVTCNTCADNQETTDTDCKAVTPESTNACPDNGMYIGSLYQKLVRYALQVCVRPSATNKNTVPETILQDISTVMQSVTVDMGKELARECERLDGIWISTPDSSKKTDKLQKTFYNDTDSNKQWGYCIEVEEQNNNQTNE
ncbi:MAG: hypothetical protein ACLRFJ_02660 [Alphaproteobacteria bacterium]